MYAIDGQVLVCQFCPAFLGLVEHYIQIVQNVRAVRGQHHVQRAVAFCMYCSIEDILHQLALSVGKKAQLRFFNVNIHYFSQCSRFRHRVELIQVLGFKQIAHHRAFKSFFE